MYELNHDIEFSEENATAEKEDTIHLTILSYTFEFSNESVHLPSTEKVEKTIYLKNVFELKNIGYVLKVFPNGMGEDDIGYVSLMLHHIMHLNNFKGTCIISVLDVSGNTRFSQSFTFFDEQQDDSLSVQPAAIKKYISRKTLLSEPDDLLWNDILVLNIDVYVSRNYCLKSRLEMGCMFDLDDYSPSSAIFHNHCGNYVFNLDSPLGKLLADESSFFRNILDSPMKERSTNMMQIPDYEYETFRKFELLLERKSSTFFHSVKKIFDMYIVADKYDIPIAMEFSRCFIKLCLFDHSMKRLLEMTEELQDENLKELMKEQIIIINKEHDVKEISIIRLSDYAKDVVLLKAFVYGGFWAYRNDINTINFWFLKEKSSRIEESIQNEIHTYENRKEFLFDFYK